MMATKPRPSDDVVEEATPEVVSTDDKQAEIERRLAMLGIEEPVDVAPEPTPTQVEEETEEVETETPPPPPPPAPPVDLLSTQEATPAPTMTEAEEPKVEVPVKPTPVQPQPVVQAPTPAIKAPTPAVKSSKSALLARIMAAQERAKQAQMKQASQETTTTEPEATSMQFEKEKMLRALNGISEDTKKKEEPQPPAIFQPPAPPMTSNTVAPPPPPSFEMFEMQMQQQPMADVMPPPPAPVEFMAPPPPVMSAPAAPPAFDSLSLDIFEAPATASAPSASAPTAPPVEAAAPDLLEGFGGIMPVPVAPPPPQMEQTHTKTTALEEVYGCDLDGLALSPEEKARMIEEQRAIMEQIAKEASNEKTSMAAIKADAFAARMTGGGPTAAAAAVDGFSASEVEEQRKILEMIEKEKSKSKQSSSVASAAAVDIGGGRKVALHGSEKTQDSIDKGTAALVLCLNCNNWMQVAETATLMFCPICSVVSPVVKQDQIMSKEEILQMEEDRKLAERLQAEAYGEGEVSEYPGNRRSAAAAAGGAAAAAAAASAGEKSWWDTINDAMVSVGIASAEPEIEEGKRSAEINTSSGHRMLHTATTGEEGGDERVGLLGGGDDGYPAARVAQGKPLFSCVVDSISSTANMIAGGDEEEVHGVDTTSFLATPNVGRDRNESSGSYYAVPDHD